VKRQKRVVGGYLRRRRCSIIEMKDPDCSRGPLYLAEPGEAKSTPAEYLVTQDPVTRQHESLDID
jgi:hypothetical protein